MNGELCATEVKEDKVVELMKVNADKVLEKDQKLSELDNRVDALLTAAAEFEQQGEKLNTRNHNVANSRYGDVGARSSDQSTISNKKFQMAQAEVDKAVEIMKVHINEVLQERDHRLSELDERVDALPSAAAEFEQQGGKLNTRNHNVANSRYGDVGARSSDQSTISNKKFQMAQAEVDKAVEIMKVHINEVLERDHRLSELDERVDALPSGAAEFERRTRKSRWFKLFK